MLQKEARWVRWRANWLGVGGTNSSAIRIVQLAMRARLKARRRESGCQGCAAAHAVICRRRRVAFAVWLALLAFTLWHALHGEDLPAAHVEIAAGFAGICSLSHFQALNSSRAIQPPACSPGRRKLAGSHLDCAGGGWGFGGLVIYLRLGR
jgi:hypothetical protein